MLTTHLRATHREMRAMWARAQTTTVVLYVAAGLLLLAGIVLSGREIERHIGDFEAWVASLGPSGPGVFIVLCAVLSSIFVPDLLLGIAAGATFGFTLGLAALVVGTVAGAALQYALARTLLTRHINRLLALRPGLAFILTAVRQQELRLQLLIRLTPLNRAATSYALGSLSVGFPRFLAACVAMLPSLSLEVYVGYTGKHLARMVGRSEQTVVLHDIVLIVGLIVAAVAATVISSMARHALDEAAAATAPPSA